MSLRGSRALLAKGTLGYPTEQMASQKLAGQMALARVQVSHHLSRRLPYYLTLEEALWLASVDHTAHHRARHMDCHSVCHCRTPRVDDAPGQGYPLVIAIGRRPLYRRINMTTKRHLPPSRVHYQEQNPTVSIRVSREVYDRLTALREQAEKSLGDILREALGVQERYTRAVYNRGLKKGCADAEKLYRVGYRCSVCNGLLTISREDEKRAVAQYMREHGWAHSSCHRQRR